MSTHSVTAGGSNTFNGDVCIYGAGGVSFGGNDYYSDQTKVMANDISTVNLYSPAAGSAPVEEIKAEGEMEATLLPKIDGMYADLMSALGSLDGQQYGGDLVPDFVKDPATGTATVKVKNGWWSIQPGQVEPYTIYVVNGRAPNSRAVWMPITLPSW